jgi:hypothetical protein
MKRFLPNCPNKTNNTSVPAWCQAKRLLHAAINRLLSKAKEVSTFLHHLTAQNELLNDKNDRLCKVLSTKKKHNKKSKVLDLQQRNEYYSGAVFWSPRKVREACSRDATNKRLQDAENICKGEMKKLKAATTFYNKKIAEEKRVAQEEAKVVRDWEKAEKAAATAAEKAAQNTKKSILTTQLDKRKFSLVFSSKDKYQKHSGSAAAAAEVVPVTPHKVERSGRAVKLSTQYT